MRSDHKYNVIFTFAQWYFYPYPGSRSPLSINQNEQTAASALQRGEKRASGHSSSETHFPYIELGQNLS